MPSPNMLFSIDCRLHNVGLLLKVTKSGEKKSDVAHKYRLNINQYILNKFYIHFKGINEYHYS